MKGKSEKDLQDLKRLATLKRIHKKVQDEMKLLSPKTTKNSVNLAHTDTNEHSSPARDT